MSKEDLKPLGKDPKYDKTVRDKLKGSASPKRKFAQSLRRLKENPTKTTAEIYELISSPNASAAQIQDMIKEASQMDLKPSEFIQLIGMTINKHRAVFGNKLELDANVDCGKKIKELEIQCDSVKRVVSLILNNVTITGLWEWKDKFTPKQVDAMLEFIKERFNKEEIEKQSKLMYMYRMAIVKTMESGLKIKDLPQRDIDEMDRIDFTLPELTNDGTLMSNNLIKSNVKYEDTKAYELMEINKEIEAEEKEKEKLIIVKSSQKKKEEKKEEENEVFL